MNIDKQSLATRRQSLLIVGRPATAMTWKINNCWSPRSTAGKIAQGDVPLLIVANRDMQSIKAIGPDKFWALDVLGYTLLEAIKEN